MAPRALLVAITTLLALLLLAAAAAQPSGETWFTLVATGTAMDVRTLIAAGADVHARDTRGATALHATAQWTPYRHARPYLLDTHAPSTQPTSKETS